MPECQSTRRQQNERKRGIITRAKGISMRSAGGRRKEGKSKAYGTHISSTGADLCRPHRGPETTPCTRNLKHRWQEYQENVTHVRPAGGNHEIEISQLNFLLSFCGQRSGCSLSRVSFGHLPRAPGQRVAYGFLRWEYFVDKLLALLHCMGLMRYCEGILQSL